MTPLVAVELICAAFVAVLLIGQFRNRDDSKSAGWLKINSIAMLCWLLVDAGAYLTGLQYVLTLLAYSLGSINLFFFLGYVCAYTGERTPVNPRIFLVPQILALLLAAAAAVEFIAGKIIVYENGVVVAVNEAPLYFAVIQGILILFALAVAIAKRKALGGKAVVLFCIFSLSALIGLLLTPFLGADYTVAFSAIALMIIVTFLHNSKSGFRPENAFAAVIVVIILCLVLQSGAFTKDPVVEKRADNCYEKTLNVVTDSDYLPYSFYDDEGNVQGHDVELIIMIANEMKMNLDLRFLPWDEGIEEAVNGRTDVLMTCDYSDSFAGVDTLLKTDPVSADEFIVYSKNKIRSVDELYDMKCAVMENGNVMPQIRMLNLTDACQMYPDNRAAMKALDDGEADCAIMRYTVGESLLKESGETDISGMFSIGKSYMCFGITGNNEQLLEEINEVLKTLKQNGELEKLDKKWLTTFIHEYSFTEQLANNPWMIVVIVLLAVSVVAYIMRERQKKRKEKERIRTEQMAGIAGDVSAYIINPKTDSFQIFKQAEYLSGIYNPGENFAQFFEKYIETDVYEPDRETVREAMSLPALLENLENDNEYRLAFRDISSGSPRWYELHAAGLSDEEILLGFSDINEDYAGQIIFGKMKEDYFALVYLYLDSATAHVLKDEPGILAGAGTAMQYSEMIDKAVSTMSGETKDYFVRLGDIGYLREKFATENKAEYIYTSDYTGETHWINLTQHVLERTGGGEPLVVAFGFAFLDEETKNVQKLQLEIARQQQELEKAFDMAEAANRAKTDFLFNMSHDIRTPMNAIIGFTNIAKKEIDDRGKALDSLNKVQTSSEILLNLINDVLDMSRIESGKVELHEEKHELVDVFDSFEPAMASLADAKNIDLSFSVGEIRDRFVFADGPRFDRVLINIVSNAIKYTPAGGTVKVSADQIEDTKPGFGSYRFVVADNGIGMSEEFQKRMFENFSREENSTTRGIQGTGLGLALAKKLVDLMGGTISCASTQGIGTTFTIIFPFRLQTESDISEAVREVQEFEELDLRGRMALLVEDNELNREIAEEILSEEGIIVETAADGREGVDRVVERGADYYDFILMDIQMPVIDGYEATRMIHRLVPELRAPIIALSANAFAEDKQKSLEAGMDDHVAKPINVRELMAALAKFL